MTGWFLFSVGETEDADTDPPTLDGYNYTRPHTSVSDGSLDGFATQSASGRDGVMYTADMFGDIENSNSKESSAMSNNKASTTVENPVERKSCLSQNIREDEYAQSLANGFTIIIDSVDDTNDFGLPPFSSDEEDETTFNIVGGNSKSNSQESISDKSVTFKEKAENVNSDTSKICDKQDEELIKEIDETIDALADKEELEKKDVEKEDVEKTVDDSKGVPEDTISDNNTAHKKKLTQRLTPPGSSKSKSESKNKLGLKLKIENEVATNFAPYMKSVTSKTKPQTNKARQLHSLVSKQKKSNGSIPLNVKSNGRQGSRKASTEKKGGQAIVRNTTRTESVTSTDGLDSQESSPMGNENHQITCVADVHREKTLSPKTENSDMTSKSNPASPRQRKISVISIGSVLKDGRETLV